MQRARKKPMIDIETVDMLLQIFEVLDLLAEQIELLENLPDEYGAISACDGRVSDVVLCLGQADQIKKPRPRRAVARGSCPVQAKLR